MTIRPNTLISLFGTALLAAGALLLCGNAAYAQQDSLRKAVVRIGYVEGDERNMTGKADMVTQDKMNKGLVNNSLEALSGQSAGVSISRGNSSSMLNTVRVRGTTSLTGGNDPLVIIDGVSSDLATLNTIYPADIESFTILKDAAETAQYGSRGAAGVIEVQTKKGSGGSFRISYDGNFAIEAPYRFLDMLDADGYRKAASSLGIGIIDRGHDTNFQKAIARTGAVHNHHLAFGGGGEDASYRASIGIQDHPTVVKTNGYRNYITKLDLSQNAFDGFMQVDLGIFGSLTRSSLIHDPQKLFYSAATFNPTFSKEKVGGSYEGIPSASQINNPLALLEKKNDEDNAHFNAHLRTRFNFSPHWSLSLFGSYSYNVVDLSQYFPTSVWGKARAFRSESKLRDVLGNAVLTYSNDWGKHHLEILELAEAQERKTDGFNTTVTGFTTDAFGYNSLEAGAYRPWGGTGSFYEDPRLLSFMGRLSYAFDGKYILTANARADASSKFGQNHKWGFFPSVSMAWNADREDFIREIGWISTLKFTAGVGRSGNQDAIGSYNSMQLMKPAGVVLEAGAPVITMGIIRNANPDLKWEVRSTVNLGINATFLNDRISFAADWYYSKTTDMLYNYDVSVPPFAYNKLLANLGEMSNSGFEIGLGGNIISRSDMSLNVNVNVSFQRNRLLSLSGYYEGEYLEAPDMAPIASLNGAGFHGGYNDITYQIIGQPLGVFYLPHCIGLVTNSDGTVSYQVEDLDGDGVIDIAEGKDRRIAGQAMPKAVMGANISFRFRSWDVSTQINGAFGHKIYNGTALSYMNMAGLADYNVLSKAPEKNIHDQTATDYYLEKGDYVNIDYLTIGYNIPVRRIKYAKNLRVSASLNNLVTFTGYSGLTPIINSSAVNGTLGLDDKISFPVYRSYSLGLSIQF
ncbi:MAG: SusC/RagA family TonB-linked outer membrane protein [Bacteroidales bacterium]|nr:SusC/RagA family TonB-linked outer membrane protein [Bacteroidales bacterium]